MAELAIKIGASTYEDGDVLCAFNDRRIRCTHAQYICHVNEAGFTRSGLRPNESLAEKMLQRTRQYRIERISRNEVKRITLATMAEEILSDKPNEKGEYIHVEEYFERRLAHPRHAVFGSPGREVMYGGRTYYEDARLTQVWNDIETHSSWREANHRRWPAGSDDLRVHFFIAVDNMEDAVAEEIVTPMLDMDSNGTPIWEEVNEERLSVPYDPKSPIPPNDGKKWELSTDHAERPVDWYRWQRVVVSTYTGEEHPEKVSPAGLWWERKTLKKRRHKVQWDSLPGLSSSTKTNIWSPSKSVDIREVVTFNRLQIVTAKSLQVIVR